MSTEDLIDRLVAEPMQRPPSPGSQLAWTFTFVLCAIATACFALFGAPFPSLPSTGFAPYAMKLGVTLAILFASSATLLAACTPGRTTVRLGIFLAIPFAVTAALAGMELAATGPAGMGGTWARCLLTVGGFGLAGTGIALSIARRLAPTSPPLAGFLAGTAGGGLAAVAYGIWCPETEAQFLLLWYVLPILALGAIGALAGNRLLRW